MSKAKLEFFALLIPRQTLTLQKRLGGVLLCVLISGVFRKSFSGILRNVSLPLAFMVLEPPIYICEYF